MIYYIFYFFIIDVVFGAKLINCPLQQIQFEKIVGLKPTHVVELLLYQEPNRQPTALQCLAKCASIEECTGFVLHYKSAICFWYRTELNSDEELDSIVDEDVAWFVKTCLKVQNCTKQWIFERSVGSTMVGNDVKILPRVVTRQECQQQCLNETSFACRSAKFIVGHRNENQVVGKCVLSDTDRHLMPNAFRVSRSDEEYLDNQCSKATNDSFCPFEEYNNIFLSHADVILEDKTKDECEMSCQNTKDFNCRGYTIWPISNSATAKYRCFIHSEDSKLLGPKLLIDRFGVTHYEKAPCLNITVKCSNKNMSIIYLPNFNFYGKIYMKGYFDSPGCFVNGRGMQMLTLETSLRVKQCGIMQALSNTNSTLFHTTVILQYNNFVQTQADRVIRVGCIYGNSTKVVVGTGVNFTSDLPNTGAIVINSNGNLPKVIMKIVDFYTHEEVSETQIGQELELIIEVVFQNGSFDISAGHLVAMTPNSEDSILLLDDRGCPTNLNVFPALTKTSDDSVKRLTANFQAFKFSSSSTIRFSVMVMFCPTECPTVDCGGYISNRIKRSQLGNVANTTSVRKVKKQEFDKMGREIMHQLPLELIITVRNPKDITSDKLIFGESNKLLIADYDIATQKVCVDYTLFIAMVALWVLILLVLVGSAFFIIRKYKRYYRNLCVQRSIEEVNKNFGLGYSNLDNRRVHFANGGD